MNSTCVKITFLKLIIHSPVKEKINFTHDDMVSDLNFLLNDKAQVQIELNETWEEVKCTKKNVSLNLFWSIIPDFWLSCLSNLSYSD